MQKKHVDRKVQRPIAPVVVKSSASNTPFDAVLPLDASPKIKACIQHWVDGLTWEETGIIEWSLERNRNRKRKGLKPLDKLVSESDFKKRYEDLDRIYDDIASKGAVFSSAPNDPTVHIGPEGEVFLGGGAHHRTAIAWVLNVKIPVYPFLVHERGLERLGGMVWVNTPFMIDPGPDLQAKAICMWVGLQGAA